MSRSLAACFSARFARVVEEEGSKWKSFADADAGGVDSSSCLFLSLYLYLILYIDDNTFREAVAVVVPPPVSAADGAGVM